jgi:hypothetical protein
MAKQKVVLYSKYHVQPSLESWQWRCSKMRILSLNLVKTELWACKKHFSHPSFLYFISWNPTIKLKLGWQIGRRLIIATHLDPICSYFKGSHECSSGFTGCDLWTSSKISKCRVTYWALVEMLSVWVLHLIQAFQCTLDMSATPDPRFPVYTRYECYTWSKISSVGPHAKHRWRFSECFWGSPSASGVAWAEKVWSRR